MSLSRRHFLAQLTAAAAVARYGTIPSLGVQSRPRPTAQQLNWQRDEFALFVHFGVNTFTDREWGDGTESPSIFNPTRLDARQWVRTAKAAGAKSMVLTAKHHDGFCLWPTATTTHSVASSPWRNRTGDVVREFVDACRIEGVKPGLYCSPWDRNHPAYGDSARYNDVYMAQLTELFTRYGALHEVWFDGANGEGPNGKRQTYDWPRTWALVRKLQPNAIMFSDVGPDVRWIGNERGVAGETHWSTIRPESVPYIGASGDNVIASLQQGHADGSVWRPSETDVSIRPGWFYHAAEDAKVKSAEELVQLYFTSVGRNSKLLLNVPPTRDGLLHDVDVARLAGMRASLDALFANPCDVRDSVWRTDGARVGERTVRLRVPQSVSLLDLREPISQGQRVSAWSVSTTGAAPQLLASGTTIGHRQLRRISRTTVSSLTLRVETVDTVQPVELKLYA
ncbi:alpha-L-fucosidase [Gemmatimonas sp.]|jgi:alpha-L-fucosidase|uniref:alpha-L-fucosidase n=1 Tax=Gemmatimonas sp. TaxID=1962908 RepID=UPI0037C0E408